MADLIEKTVSSDLVYKGFLRVQRDRVLCPDGVERTREYILHSGAALIVPVLKDGSFAMVRQYRHSVGQVFLEFPAGKLDRGEEPLKAARRELKEETGYDAQAWKFLGRIHPCIGYSNEFIDIYLATDLIAGETSPDPGEELEPVVISLAELKAKIGRGEVTDAKTLSALLYYEIALGNV